MNMNHSFKTQAQPRTVLDGHLDDIRSRLRPTETPASVVDRTGKQLEVLKASGKLVTLKEKAHCKEQVLFDGSVGPWHVIKSVTSQGLPSEHYLRMQTPLFPIEMGAQDFLNQLNRALELANSGRNRLDIDTIKLGQGIPLELITFTTLANFNIKKPVFEIASMLDIFQINRWGVMMEGAPRIRTILEQNGKLNWENLPYAKNTKCFEINSAFGTGEDADTFGAFNRDVVGIFDQDGLSTLKVASIYRPDLTKRFGDFSGTEVGVECHRPINIPQLGGIVPSEIRAWMSMFSTGKTELNNDVFEYSLEFEPNADLSQVAVNVDFNRGRLGAMDGVKLSMSTTL